LVKLSVSHASILSVGGGSDSQFVFGRRRKRNQFLLDEGVAAVFQPGTAMDDIVKFIRANVKGHAVPQA